MARKRSSIPQPDPQPEPLDALHATGDHDAGGDTEQPGEPTAIELQSPVLPAQKEAPKSPAQLMTERISGTQWRHLHSQDLGNGAKLAIAMAPGRALITLMRPNAENPEGIIGQSLIERTFVDRVQVVTRKLVGEDVTQRMEFVA